MTGKKKENKHTKKRAEKEKKKYISAIITKWFNILLMKYYYKGDYMDSIECHLRNREIFVI